MSRADATADAIVAQARQLKMPGLARGFVALARQAREDKWAVEDYLHEVLALARGEWLARGDNVVFVGPIGTGKTHLAIALGSEAARQRRHVAFWRVADLVRALVEARDARDLGRLQRRLDRVDLLVLDELGFVPFDRAGGELLFGVIAQRYEKRSVLVTSNLAFSEWPKVLGGDDKLTAALLDRLTDHATIISTKGKSYRMRRRAG